MKLKLIGAILIYVLFAGCRSPLVVSSRLFVDTVGEEYLEYVERDTTLDERAKNARRENIYWYRKLIEEAEK